MSFSTDIQGWKTIWPALIVGMVTMTGCQKNQEGASDSRVTNTTSTARSQASAPAVVTQDLSSLPELKLPAKVGDAAGDADPAPVAVGLEGKSLDKQAKLRQIEVSNQHLKQRIQQLEQALKQKEEISRALSQKIEQVRRSAGQ